MIQNANQSTQLSDLLQRMTPGQRLRAHKLLAEYAALKREVLNPTAIEEAFPCLASPRSSLSPDRLTTFALYEEVVDGDLAAQAQRASYRASEEQQ